MIVFGILVAFRTSIELDFGKRIIDATFLCKCENAPLSRFMSKEDWNAIIEQEEGELFVVSLIDEILAKSQNVLFEKRIDIQVLPYTVSYCKNVLLDLINVKIIKLVQILQTRSRK